MRAQVDRITSRQLLNQEQFEQKLEQVMRRQATLESRAATLAGVPDPAPTGSIKSRPAPIADPPPGDIPKAAPISDTVIFTAPPDREARLESRELRRSAGAAHRRRDGGQTVGDRRRGYAGSPAGLARSRRGTPDGVAQHPRRAFRFEGQAYSRVLADLGMDGKKVPAGVQVASVGGPFVPLTLRKDAGGFERQLYRIHVARANVEKLTRTLGAVPVRKPIMGEIDLSSGFGCAPIRSGPAGDAHRIDFRSSTGDPVRATATGVVESAGYNGGYGKMVEIDHGNGFSTRYGHMSEIEVKVGQQIKIGQIIRRVGSTGRSTGPHLHYEPASMAMRSIRKSSLRAGLRLGNAL